MLVIGHLTDTHFGGDPSAVERSKRVLAHLAAFVPPVDVLVVTGDVADHGTPEEYAEATRVFAGWPGPAPVLWCPGNHDVRQHYAAFRGEPEHPPAEPLDEYVRVGGVLFCLLDSLVPARDGRRIDHGHLQRASLDRLDRELAARAPGEPAIVCFHHPPVDLHMGRMDPIRLDDPDELADVLAAHADVAAVLTGHAHTAAATSYAGLPLRIGGGVASTVTLDQEQEGAGWAPITHDLGPSLAVHVLDDAGGLVTHWRTL
ncbi:metallophosphoesterase [Nocardioides panacisoli]|uniref:metallophosphoesterase n=1 Tax=Nocardioides panacisoli TaxID=627624 RepID=UPI001C627348|nr:metallophosphoesterase [Nocardioides panacisoli]QYJ03681.1 metallophosphoesterase [Nocardioides panacisoli]